jgi:steroid delta-isomerase-like uncharacterized protein
MLSLETTAHIPYDDPRFQEAYGIAWSGTDDGPLLRYFAEDGEYTDMGSSATFRGHKDIARFRRAMFNFSADSRIVFTTLLRGSRGFASEWTWSGTASGELRLDGRTYPATNRPYSVQGVALCTVDEAGAITAHRDFYDMRALLKQLGLV